MWPNQIYYQVGMPDIHSGYGFAIGHHSIRGSNQIYYETLSDLLRVQSDL